MSDQPDHLSESRVRKLFSESGYFETLDDAVIREFADASEVVHVSAGERAAEPQIGVRTLSPKCDPIEVEALTMYERSS